MQSFKVLAATLLAALATTSGAVFLESNETSAGAGSFTSDNTGAGPGGANQTSFLEHTCPATATLMSGGVAGVDPGTRLTQNSPKSTTASKWRVAWLNDGTPDTIIVRVVCFTGDLPTRLEEATQVAPPDDGATAVRACNSGAPMTGGGFFGVAGGSRLIQSNPFFDGSFWAWQARVYNPTNSDTFGVRLICAEDGFDSYIKTRTRQNATFVDVTCNPGDFLLSGGYTQISAGKPTSSAPRPGNSPLIWRVTSSRPADITAVVVCYNQHVCRTASPATCVPRNP